PAAGEVPVPDGHVWLILDPRGDRARGGGAVVTANRRTGRSRPSSTDGGSPTGRPAGGPHGRGGPPGPDRPPPPRGRDPGSSAARGALPVGPPGGPSPCPCRGPTSCGRTRARVA